MPSVSKFGYQPKGFIKILFSYPELVAQAPRTSAINNLLVFLLRLVSIPKTVTGGLSVIVSLRNRDAVNEFAYLGQQAGLGYTLKPLKIGFELTIRGENNFLNSQLLN